MEEVARMEADEESDDEPILTSQKRSFTCPITTALLVDPVTK